MAVFEPQGKTFVVTGGASGMGALYVEKFLEQGAKAIAVLDVAVEKGQQLAERHNQWYPGKVIFFKCDVAKEDEIEKTFSEIVSKFNRIDVIINNATIMNDTPGKWRHACDVNWQGVVSFTLKGYKHMSEGAGGTILNVVTAGALTKSPVYPIYWGSNIAVLHFSQCLTMDHPYIEPHGVRIVCLCLGPTATSMMKNMDKNMLDPKLGIKLREAINSGLALADQKQESAVASGVYVIKHGASGSIWLSADDKPPKNITSDINETFERLEAILVKS